MKHLKQYNSLIFESVTKDTVTKNISDSDIVIDQKEIDKRVTSNTDWIRNNPQHKSDRLSDLENIKRGLSRGGDWIGETEDSDAYQLWYYHYQGFTRENMEALIAGVYAKLVKEEADKIIQIAKEFLQKNPTYKDFLLQSLTHEF